jgi:hypothetical protein
MGIDTDWDLAGAGEQPPPQAPPAHAAEPRADAQMRVLHAHIRRTIEQTDELIRRANHRDTELHELRSQLKRNTEITEEVRELLGAFKGALRVMGWLSRCAKWGGALAAAGTAIYTALYMATHGGRLPGN